MQILLELVLALQVQVRSGYINATSGRLESMGIDGQGWSSTAGAYTSVTNATAYRLFFDAIEVYPSRGPYTRWYGFPLRCLAD